MSVPHGNGCWKKWRIITYERTQGMTGFLASVASSAEAQRVCTLGVDVIDLKDPARGRWVRSIKTAYAPSRRCRIKIPCSAPLSATSRSMPGNWRPASLACAPVVSISSRSVCSTTLSHRSCYPSWTGLRAGASRWFWFFCRTVSVCYRLSAASTRWHHRSHAGYL